MIANGGSMKCGGRCENVHLQIGEYHLKSHMFAIDMDGCDILDGCPFLRHFVLVFFDDILIYRKTWTNHLTHVDQVLHLLFKKKIFLKQSKCSFGTSQVGYLVHIVGKDGV